MAMQKYGEPTCDASSPHFSSFDRKVSSPSQRQLTLHLNKNSRERSKAEAKYLLAESRDERKYGAGRRSYKRMLSPLRNPGYEEPYLDKSDDSH